MTQLSTENKYASVDTIYSEASADVRQIRNYELSSAKWYTTILVAVVGFILICKFTPTEKATKLSILLNDNFVFQLVAATIITLIALFTAFSIMYAHKLHRQIEQYIDENLAPETIPRKMNVTLIKGLSPRFFQISTILSIVIIGDIFIFMRL